MSAGLLVTGLLLLYAVASGKAAAMWAAITGQAPPAGAAPPPAEAPPADDTGSANGLPGTPSQPFPQPSANGSSGLQGSPYMGLGGYGNG